MQKVTGQVDNRVQHVHNVTGQVDDRVQYVRKLLVK